MVSVKFTSQDETLSQLLQNRFCFDDIKEAESFASDYDLAITNDYFEVVKSSLFGETERKRQEIKRTIELREKLRMEMVKLSIKRFSEISKDEPHVKTEKRYTIALCKKISNNTNGNGWLDNLFSVFYSHVDLTGDETMVTIEKWADQFFDTIAEMAAE